MKITAKQTTNNFFTIEPFFINKRKTNKQIMILKTRCKIFLGFLHLNTTFLQRLKNIIQYPIKN